MYPKKWKAPITTSTRIEEVYKRIADLLELEVTEATNLGMQVMIEDSLEKLADPRVTPEMVRQYREVRDHHLKEIEIALHQREIHDAKIRELEEKRQTATTKRSEITGGKIIQVWDRGEEKYKQIPEKEFDPDWMVRA